MKQNFIFEPSRTYQEQHMLPISPQNFDPFDKSRDQSAYKKTIFSTSSKPKASYESIFELDNIPQKGEEATSEADLKRVLSREMRGHLDSLKGELLESFSALLKDSRFTGKISGEEMQEIKRQIIYNKTKFEDIQEHIAHLGQQYSEINAYCTREGEGMRNSSTYSGMSRNDRTFDQSLTNEITQKQLEIQFKNFKQGLIGEVHNAMKMKGKSILNEDVVGELKQIKYSFETDLKQNFEMINGRVKRAEENLNEIMRKKRDYMDAIRDEFLTSIGHQESSLTQEIKHLENVVRSKCEQTQAKAIVSGEINKRMDLFRTEVDALRKVITSNNEEMERVDTLVTKKLENLDFDMKRQFFEVQTIAQKTSNVQQSQDLFERRIQKLNGDSETYNKTIQQLRGQVEEVTKVHKLLQSQASTPSSQGIITRLEEKIADLQKHIQELETQVKRQGSRANSFIRQNEEAQIKSEGTLLKNKSLTTIKTETENVQEKSQSANKTIGAYNNESVNYYGGVQSSKNLMEEFNQNKNNLVKSPVRQDGISQGSRTDISNYVDTNIKSQDHANSLQNKKLKHAKILAQINYFINGTVSNFLDDEEDAEIYCNLDDDGYIFDEDGDFVLDGSGIKVKLTPQQIDRFNNNNMIE